MNLSDLADDKLVEEVTNHPEKVDLTIKLKLLEVLERVAVALENK